MVLMVRHSYEDVLSKHTCKGSASVFPLVVTSLNVCLMSYCLTNQTTNKDYIFKCRPISWKDQKHYATH